MDSISQAKFLSGSYTREESTRRQVLIVGTFLSSHRMVRSACEDLAERLEDAGWTVLRTSASSSRFKRLVDMIAVVILDRRSYSVAIVDVFSGFGFVWAELVSFLLRRMGKPHVLTLRGGNLPKFAGKWPGRVGRLLNGASVVATPSAYLREEMRQYRPNIRVISNPIDLSTCPFRYRERLTPRLVWLRAFDYIYNPHMAIRVLKSLVSKRPDASLLMVGQDKGDGSLASTRQLARELGVENNVTFVEGVPYSRVPEVLGQRDVFINTTTADNTPVSVILAMACGLPVITTNVGGIPYLLEDECDALLVPNDDDRAMHHAIIRLLDDSDLSRKLATNARKKASSFDWERVLQRWEDLLLNVQNPGHRS